jgi:hypothetical protein
MRCSFWTNERVYVSIGGQPTSAQLDLIRAAAARMPSDGEIVAAMDADSDGAKLSDVVRQAVDLTGRADLRFCNHEPVGFKDWNDQLRAEQRALSFPAVRVSSSDVS